MKPGAILGLAAMLQALTLVKRLGALSPLVLAHALNVLREMFAA